MPKTSLRFPDDSGLFIALLLYQGVSSAMELNDTLMIKAQRSFPNKTFMFFLLLFFFRRVVHKEHFMI